MWWCCYIIVDTERVSPFLCAQDLILRMHKVYDWESTRSHTNLPRKICVAWWPGTLFSLSGSHLVVKGCKLEAEWPRYFMRKDFSALYRHQNFVVVAVDILWANEVTYFECIHELASFQKIGWLMHTFDSSMHDDTEYFCAWTYRSFFPLALFFLSLPLLLCKCLWNSEEKLALNHV